MAKTPETVCVIVVTVVTVSTTTKASKTVDYTAFTDIC